MKLEGKPAMVVIILLIIYIATSNILTAYSIIYSSRNKQEPECVKANGVEGDKSNIVLCIKP